VVGLHGQQKLMGTLDLHFLKQETAMSKEKWSLDSTHSELGFKIRHLMISNVSGYIRDFQVEAETSGNDFAKASITLTAKIANLLTNDDKRDAHLRSADFFDAENFPDLKFKSTSIEMVDGSNFTLNGELTMKGVTKEIGLDVEFGGIAKNGSGNETAGFTVTGKIKRNDWGITFNRVLDNGGLGVGEEVKISGEIRMVKQVATEAA
jgi:polyisoprenoid-binding protein YceI